MTYNSFGISELKYKIPRLTKVGNCGTYSARQLYFKTGKIPSKFDLHKLLKGNPHFQAMYSHVAQQCLTAPLKVCLWTLQESHG